MDSELPSLSQALRELVDEERLDGRAEPHPEPEHLASYQAGELMPAEAEAIRDHLALCPDCASLILVLAELPAAGPAPPAPCRWSGGRAALAALLAATVGLGVWAASLRHQIGELERPHTVLHRIVLTAEGDGTRSAAREEDTVAPAGEPWLLFLELPAEARTYPSYEIEIAPALWRETIAGGAVHGKWLRVSIPGGSLKPGIYRGRLYGILGGERELLVDRTFRLGGE